MSGIIQSIYESIVDKQNIISQSILPVSMHGDLNESYIWRPF